MTCDSVKAFVETAHECLARGQGDMPCCTNFLLMSPLMIAASAVRLVVNVIFGVLAFLALCVSYCCIRKSTCESMKASCSLAFQNVISSIGHIVISAFNIISLGYLVSSYRGITEFDLTMKSALLCQKEEEDDDMGIN